MRKGGGAACWRAISRANTRRKTRQESKLSWPAFCAWPGRTGRARKHGVAYTFVTNVTEGIRMDDIIRNTKAEVQRLKYDEDGCLILVEENQK